MGGTSQRADAATKLQGNLEDYNKTLQGLNATTDNRFNNYQDQFGYGDFYNSLAGIHSANLGTINRQRDTGIASALAAAKARNPMATGSLAEGLQVNASNPFITAAYDATDRENSGFADKTYNLMGYANQRKEDITGKAQNVDFQNLDEMFKKYGLIGDNYNAQGTNLQNLSNKTALDDVFAGINTAANIAGTVSGFTRKK